jgi:GntR family transcriptional regulator
VQFDIDPRSPVTPSEQLADQVRFAVAAGRLGAGDRLPSVREVAKEARLNPNTVSRAWRELELSGVLKSRRGSGMFVTPEGPSIAATFRTRMVAERLGRAVGDALAAGLEAAEVIELTEDACRAWPLGREGNEESDGAAQPAGEQGESV